MYFYSQAYRMIWATPHTHFGSILLGFSIKTITVPFTVFPVYHTVLYESPNRIGRLQINVIPADLPGIDTSYHRFNLAPP